jgi:hypothetical protein
MKTLPSSANSACAPSCAALVVIRPLVERTWNVAPVCISMKQPVP